MSGRGDMSGTSDMTGMSGMTGRGDMSGKVGMTGRCDPYFPKAPLVVAAMNRLSCDKIRE
ncbi:MAG: hypothetical protein LBQ01_06945 [Prevotellaceae bacterium]|jgi:hypothetical protein|nr:hypothetical protein [Prevotellaceae bacterium]